MEPLKTIDEFNKAVRSYMRRTMIVLSVALLTLVVCLSVVCIFRKEIRGGVTQRFGETAAELSVSLLMLPTIAVLFVGLWINERLAKQDATLRCPHCHKLLSGQQYLTVATRNCGFCGRRVLAEPDEAG